ncbi:MAG: type II toxin-antitoxin system VapB family antitoxin [Candidatus Nanopelagicales bacterium]
MADILVRDVPDNVVSALDARAARLGLSRNEFLRRRFAQEAVPLLAVNVDDLRSLAQTFGDLADPDVMKGAWA